MPITFSGASRAKSKMSNGKLKSLFEKNLAAKRGDTKMEITRDPGNDSRSVTEMPRQSYLRTSIDRRGTFSSFAPSALRTKPKRQKSASGEGLHAFHPLTQKTA
jgi:hypothetical protein